MRPQCPSVSNGAAHFTHEDCRGAACSWWEGRCTAAETIPVERLVRHRGERVSAVELACALADSCRWMRDARKFGTICPPMRMGEVCSHQGGEYDTWILEDEVMELDRAGDVV